MDVFSDDSPQIKLGFHKLDIAKSEWIIPNYYQPTMLIGSGAYGTVCAATDTRTSRKVAIKKFSRPFSTPIHAKCAHRELRLLRLMNHDNIIKIVDMFTSAENDQDMNDAYFVTPLMDTTLERVLREQREKQVQYLDANQIKIFIYQILRAVKYIHSANLVHRDLKPGNIAVNEDCDLKILDFGLARQAEAEMTGYVATRWYRAPEIMLNWRNYDKKVDIWSVGCILGELLKNHPLFDGRDNAIDQLSRIIHVCGTPTDEFLDNITSKEAKNYIRNHMPKMDRQDFTKLFDSPLATPEAVDFLDKTLQIDPEKRPSAEEALGHPYFSEFHDTEDEPAASQVVENPFKEEVFDLKIWRKRIWDEIKSFEQAQNDQKTVEHL